MAAVLIRIAFLLLAIVMLARLFSRASSSDPRKEENTDFQDAFKEELSRKSAEAGSAWEVLELPEQASFDEVERQYRQLLAKYHPDKVEHLGEEFRKLAHEKTLQIQAAFDELAKQKMN